MPDAKPKRKTSTRKKADDKKVKYYVEKSAGEDVIIEVPGSWKVTFGYVNPSSSPQAMSRGEGHCLRMYEGTKLRLVMGNVKGFRDLDIPLARKFEKQSGEAKWEQDSKGGFERTESRKQIEAGFEVEELEDDPF